jgi:hypothetical protein
MLEPDGSSPYLAHDVPPVKSGLVCNNRRAPAVWACEPGIGAAPPQGAVIVRGGYGGSGSLVRACWLVGAAAGLLLDRSWTISAAARRSPLLRNFVPKAPSPPGPARRARGETLDSARNHWTELAASHRDAIRARPMSERIADRRSP